MNRWEEEENLLLVSSFIGVDQVVELTAQYGGVAFPAHVDRDSYSVIASLGAIPPEAGFTAAELTRECDDRGIRQAASGAEGPCPVPGLRFPLSGNIGSGILGLLALPERSVKAVLDAVRGLN